MALKAKLKWSNEDVLIRPVFFSWHVGLQYKCTTGYRKNSIFCDTRKEFIFPIETEIAMLFVKLWYWIKEYAYMQIRYWIPHRIKRAISKKETAGDEPIATDNVLILDEE